MGNGGRADIAVKYDELANDGRPWEHTSKSRYAAFKDRKSAMLIYADMPTTPGWMPGAMPMYANRVAASCCGRRSLRPQVFCAHIITMLTLSGASATRSAYLRGVYPAARLTRPESATGARTARTGANALSDLPS